MPFLLGVQLGLTLNVSLLYSLIHAQSHCLCFRYSEIKKWLTKSFESKSPSLDLSSQGAVSVFKTWLLAAGKLFSQTGTQRAKSRKNSYGGTMNVRFYVLGPVVKCISRAGWIRPSRIGSLLVEGAAEVWRI